MMSQEKQKIQVDDFVLGGVRMRTGTRWYLTLAKRHKPSESSQSAELLYSWRRAAYGGTLLDTSDPSPWRKVTVLLT